MSADDLWDTSDDLCETSAVLCGPAKRVRDTSEDVPRPFDDGRFNAAVICEPFDDLCGSSDAIRARKDALCVDRRARRRKGGRRPRRGRTRRPKSRRVDRRVDRGDGIGPAESGLRAAKPFAERRRGGLRGEGAEGARRLNIDRMPARLSHKAALTGVLYRARMPESDAEPRRGRPTPNPDAEDRHRDRWVRVGVRVGDRRRPSASVGEGPAPVVAHVRRHDRDLDEQLRTALSSVALNAAEGIAAKEATASRASRRRRAPTRSRAPRCGWRSRGAT